MRVHRGRADSIADDRDATRALVEHVATTGEPGLRVWYPHHQVAFGRRDADADGYERARAIADGLGYPPVERSVGGRAVAFTGDVLAFVRAEPADATEPALQTRYDSAIGALQAGLAAFGAATRRGEPSASFCPGAHSLRTDGGKVAGLAQRVRRAVAVVAGAVVVRDANAVADVLDPVYDALGVPFEPASVGSVAAAAERDVTEDALRTSVEDALVGNREMTVRTVRET